MSDKKGKPDSWTIASIEEIAALIQYGHTASARVGDDGPRFLRITDIQNGQVEWQTVPTCEISLDDLGKYRLDTGDIVFARTGATTGKSFLIRQCPEAVFASYLIRLRMYENVLPSFVQFFFQTSDYWRQIEGGKRGIGQPNVNSRVLGKLRLPIAPLNEQRRIVAKIDELFSDLDAGVAALERAKAKLKRYRAAVLKAAVEGRLTAEWRSQHPDVEPASKLLERILKERRRKWEEEQLRKYKQAGKQPPKNWRDKYKEPQPVDESTLPALPEAWCWASAVQLGDVQLGRQRSPKHVSKDYPTKYLRAANLTEEGLALSDVLEMDFKPHELEAYRLAAGDLLVSEASGSPDQVGKPAVWNDELPLCCFQNTVIRLRPAEAIGSRFLLNVFRHCYVNHVFSRLAGGVGINHLSAAKFSKVPIPLAPITEQSQIVDDVERRLSTISVLEAQINANLIRATRLRQSILKRAFEGKLVPQDPSDEPASELLARIRDGSNGKMQTSARKQPARRKTAARKRENQA